MNGFRRGLMLLLVWLPWFAVAAEPLTVGSVAADLACPCTCPLILEDCNMSCGLTWKEQIGQLIADGKTREEIMAHFLTTYGDEARLTPVQRLEGKIYQYTRGFGTGEWVALWAGLGLWMLLLVAGVYWLVQRWRRQPPTAAGRTE